MISTNKTHHLSLGFLPHKVPRLKDLVSAITRFNWSPMIFRDGHRTTDSWLCCKYLVLDFDDGYTINQIEGLCRKKGWAYVLAPTRSHQKRKGDKPPRDRFRLLLGFSSMITDRDTLAYNMQRFIVGLKSDKSCKDCARFYYPSTHIHSFSTGSLIEVKRRPTVDTRSVMQMYHNRCRQVRWNSGKLSHHIERFLDEGVYFGSGRNQSCFVTARTLRELGVTQSEALDKIKSSPFVRKNFTDTEIINTVRSAFT